MRSVRERSRVSSEEALTEALIGERLDAMAELPRSVFLLRHLDGLDVAAIGAQLGLDAEVVERQLARAMRVLVWGVGEEPE